MIDTPKLNHNFIYINNYDKNIAVEKVFSKKLKI